MDQDMGKGTDPLRDPDDAVLRRLAADLARDDPRLAALLGDSPPETRPRHGRTHLLFLLLTVPVLVTVALLVPPTVAVGVTAMLLAIASPLVVCWMCITDRTEPGAR
jgi:Flp pilus assembly protein TadB